MQRGARRRSGTRRRLRRCLGRYGASKTHATANRTLLLELCLQWGLELLLQHTVREVEVPNVGGRTLANIACGAARCAACGTSARYGGTAGPELSISLAFRTVRVNCDLMNIIDLMDSYIYTGEKLNIQL